ncbi:caspase family protein [Deinococcus aquiradiocola]|uniref:caspase family protein n=1 Tax=Deinococcus aquiradiocola TaxID=393059 RepID=UPI00166C2023|nr:caspase family protein [Deinococcus aquiradiocola]
MVLGLSVLLGLGAALAGKQEGMEFYNKGQYEQALAELKDSVLGNDGDPEAQTLLGMMYLKGQGTEKDTVLATYWFQEAARQGNATAERTLGEMYLAGNGLPQDDYQAAYWTQQAADLGDAPAQVTLGKLRLDGRGVERDAHEAFRLFSLAAGHDDADAQYQLAQLYERGEGTAADREQALRWYRAASAGGLKAAAEALQRLSPATAPAPVVLQPRNPSVPASPLVTSAAPTVKKKRIALLIADQNYQDASLDLSGPINDARLIQASLVKAGFTVTVKTNLTLVQMNRDISSFLAGVDGNTVSLLYYSGHGVEIGGANYLIPADFQMRRGLTATEAVAQSVDIAAFYARMPAQAEGSLNITILDACRDNPFKSRGLKGLGDGRDGLKTIGLTGGNGDGTVETFTAYAAASGQVAQDGVQNGPYATALAQQMTVPGQVLEVMFRNVRQEVARRTANQQIPTSYANISSEFIFVPSK